MKKICFALTIAIFAICAYFFQQNAPAILSWINTLGPLAPVFFLFLYCLASTLFLPTLALTLAGGAIFGPIAGVIINLLGATIGAICSFCISRYMIFDWVAAKNNQRINNLIEGVEHQGWQFVAVLRLMPVPFSLVNYGLGVTRIKFSHFVIATAIFLIPVEVVFTYCGYAGMDLLTHPQDLYKGTSIVLLIGLGLLAIIFKRIKKHRKESL